MKITVAKLLWSHDTNSWTITKRIILKYRKDFSENCVFNLMWEFHRVAIEDLIQENRIVIIGKIDIRQFPSAFIQHTEINNINRYVQDLFANKSNKSNFFFKLRIDFT